MVLYFFHTLGCHLCELAEIEIAPIIEQNDDLSLVKIDISESDQLVEEYGIRIPVIKIDSTSTDLGWPFSAGDVVNYLNKN